MTIRKKGGSRGDYPTGGKGGRLPPKESQRIRVFDAVRLTQRYRKAAPASEHGGFFWAEGIRQILEQPECVGLRYYHGLDSDGHYQIVLVGVDGDGKDIVEIKVRRGSQEGEKRAAAALAPTGGNDAVVLDMHWPCPFFCDSTSPLN